MSEGIIFLPTFTGEAVWWKGKEATEVFCKAPVARAIFRQGYKQLKLSFGNNGGPLGCPSEILLEWKAEEGCYEWGAGCASCQIKPELPDIGLLKGSWFLNYDQQNSSGGHKQSGTWRRVSEIDPLRGEFDEIDPDEVDIEEAVVAALEEVKVEDEEYRFRITLTPLQVNIS